jgi:hypothetical protein
MRTRTVIMVMAGVLLVDFVAVIVALIWIRPPRPVVQSRPFGMAPPMDVVVENVVEAQPVAAAPSFVNPRVNWAQVALPTDGSYVPRRFQASGRCGPVAEGTRLMLVVDSGRGVFSPKMPPLNVQDGQWSGNVAEYGAPVGGQFSLCVFAVTEEAVGNIAEWQERGRQTGSYPPFRGAVPGGVELARIKLRVGGN